jgi:hypothetical protein
MDDQVGAQSTACSAQRGMLQNVARCGPTSVRKFGTSGHRQAQVAGRHQSSFSRSPTRGCRSVGAGDRIKPAQMIVDLLASSS